VRNACLSAANGRQVQLAPLLANLLDGGTKRAAR